MYYERHKTQVLSLLFFLFFYCTVNGQTDGQVLTRVNGGASWADATGADGDAWGVSNDNDQSINITRTGSVHLGTHGNVTGYDFSVSDDNGGGILLMDDNANNETTDGETLGFISFDASDNLSSLSASAMILVSASADHTLTSKGADIRFSNKSSTGITPDGAGDGANERMIITHDGKVGINTSAVGGPNSTFHVRGSASLPIDVISSINTTDYDINDNQHTLIFEAVPSGEVNLPAAATRDGRIYHIINRSGSLLELDTPIQIFTNSTATTSTMLVGTSITIQADGNGTTGNWYLISN